MQNLIFTLNVVAPVFLIIIIGVILKLTKGINDNFVSVSSKIVFNVALPAFVFIKLATADFSQAFDLKLIIFVYAGIIFSFILIWIISILLTKNGRDRASFIQGSFRSNFVIIGFAIVFNMFGNSALSKAAILMAFVMPLFNILAVIALTVPVKKEKQLSISKTICEIITNPLLLAVIFSLPFFYFNITLPQILTKTIDYLAALTLPLALLGIGGSLNFESIKNDCKLAVIATALKIIILPATFIFLSIKCGFTGEDLGVLFILFATPTAIVSFIMAKAMDCNAELAGNIILMTTIGSVVTISLGIFLIKSAGYF